MEYLLDTSALIAYLTNERGAGKVMRVLKDSAIPFIALSEIYYITWHRKGEADADNIYGIIKGWNIPILLPNERTILLAGKFKAMFRLGLADSYIAAFASDRDLPLVTKDRDYAVLENEIKVIWV